MTEQTRNVQIEKFLELYAKFQAGATWLAKRQAEGKDNASHLSAFLRLEAQVDKEWEELPKAQKDEIMAFLAQNRAIPQEVCQAMELFGGKIVSIT